MQTSASGTTRTMVYDIFGQDVADYAGATGVTLERENLYRGGLLATYEAGSGAIKYVLQDVQGSTRAVLNNNQGSSTVIARHDYLPFGEEISSGIGLRTPTQGYGAADANRQKYGLTERDDTTGLDHTWFRKYENRSGRWTSPDPYGGSMSVADPQSLNRFSYVRNDCMNLVDPSGLNWVEKCELWTWTIKETGKEVGPRFTICHKVYVIDMVPAGGLTFGDPGGGGAPTKTDAQKRKDYHDCLDKTFEIIKRRNNAIPNVFHNSAPSARQLGGAVIWTGVRVVSAVAAAGTVVGGTAAAASSATLLPTLAYSVTGVWFVNVAFNFGNNAKARFDILRDDVDASLACRYLLK